MSKMMMDAIKLILDLVVAGASIEEARLAVFEIHKEEMEIIFEKIERLKNLGLWSDE